MYFVKTTSTSHRYKMCKCCWVSYLSKNEKIKLQKILLNSDDTIVGKCDIITLDNGN